MRDARRLRVNRIAGFLGDAISSVQSAETAAQTTGTQGVNATAEALTLNEEVTPSPYTNYSNGMLNGWFRNFDSSGGYTVVQASAGPGTLGPPPTAQQWAQFDAVAAQLGVGGFVNALKSNAMSAGSSNFLAKIGAAITSGLTTVLGKSAVNTIAQATATLDKTVPGWATLVDVLAPALPFIPAITAALAATAGVAPELVAGAFQTVQTTANAADSLSGLPAAQSSQILQPLDSYTQSVVASAVNYAAQVGTADASALAQVQATLLKALATASTTRGTAVQRLEAAGVEAAQGVILVLQVASAVVAPEAAAPLQALALALKASLTAATATGDATQTMEAVGLVIAKGLPAILLAFGASALSALPSGIEGQSVAQVPVIGGATDTLTTNAAGDVQFGSADPLFITDVGTLVKGIATVEATAISTAAGVAQVYLAAQQLQQAAAASRQQTITQAAALDTQTAALEKELAALQAQLHAQQAQTGPASLSSSPLALLALAGLGFLIVRRR